jgi:nitrite reductase (NADH) small subunit
MMSTGRCAMGEFVKVAKAGDIDPGEARRVEANGKRIALFNIDGAFYAIDDTCTHRGGPLSEGMVVGTEVTCPWHGAVFDVTTGSVLGAPAPRDVARYAAVRVEGEDIEVEL